ncbi:hypothetical protein [Sinorhizobium fredii]|uniref:Uncharacterized protein n=1 Tax=Sinorhizobium fredii (strain HH103) TaxID=1117943 RepID=A0A0A8WJZ9_SINF1|nr:hypothetical protein [Sinorhizobium fredii]CEL26587.1 unnamed protein product [Sinorhizobium fredii HH103]
MDGNPIPSVVGMAIFCVVVIILAGWQAIKARRIIKNQILQNYRAAAGNLIYQKPFANDAEAIQAINQARDFDVQFLEELMALSSPIADTVNTRRAMGRKIDGFRDLKPDVVKYFVYLKSGTDHSTLREKGFESNDSLNQDRNRALAMHAASYQRSQASLVKALSPYIDAGKIITEAAERNL